MSRTGRVTGQSLILEWMCRDILKGVANLAKDVADDMGVAANWVVWTDQ